MTDLNAKKIKNAQATYRTHSPRFPWLIVLCCAICITIYLISGV